MSSSFTSASLRSGSVPMGHFLSIDHFHMSQPTFPPHPHAGFSAITWMLPWSPGGFVNRDSLGDRSRIAPGALHWTMAGSGMLHEEIPEDPGTDCEGLQIFVKLPDSLELSTPRAFHYEPTEVPTLDLGGAVAKILVGELGGVTSKIPSHARTTMLHVDLEGTSDIAVPDGVEAFAVVLRGSATVDGVTIAADAAVGLRAGHPAKLEGSGATVLVGWGDPMEATPMFAGPFCMFTRERLAEARARYSTGAMGHLSPSNVRWAR